MKEQAATQMVVQQLTAQNSSPKYMHEKDMLMDMHEKEEQTAALYDHGAMLHYCMDMH